MGRRTANAAGNLAKAIKAASNVGSVSGAVLGTIVDDGVVELDTGQIIPNYAGPVLALGSRVLCHFINQGHEVAVQSLAGQSWALAAAVRESGGWYEAHRTSGGDWTAPAVVSNGLQVLTRGIYLITCHNMANTAMGPITFDGDDMNVFSYGADEFYLVPGTVVSTTVNHRLALDMRAPYDVPDE